MSFAPAFRVFSLRPFGQRGQAWCPAATMVRYEELEK